MNFETVIGLEVHCELKTNTKIFSPGIVDFGAAANTNTNEIDWGYPGVLPVLNKKAVDLALKASLALGCEINQYNRFDRKNYFYPDNPKAYQISQFDHPIGVNGTIEIEVDGKSKTIGIERVHMEEDAGKNSHTDLGYSLVDLNRQGTPLIEIVSDADMRSPEEAAAYLEALREVLLYAGISDVKMEEGSMRCDANISVRPYGQEKFGTKAELKNLNSISNVTKGLEHEEIRQAKVLRAGGEIQQETRRYDEVAKKTILMRVKEGASDYRYFPEPDVSPLYIDDEQIRKARASIPEMPKERRAKYVKEFGLPEYDAKVLTLSKTMSDFFEKAVTLADAKQVSNWLMGNVSEHLNAQGVTLEEIKLTPLNLAEMINLIQDGTISSKMAKKVFVELAENGGDAMSVVKAKGLIQISDPAILVPMVEALLEANPQAIEDFKNGKDRAIKMFQGQIMKETKGQANPQVVTDIILAELKKR
ncbi:MAG: Asp-tRNA(Asn)/Glu-tRNA(Gln) amidotransferase subunit GatB [Lactobacillales bacterium]|jgi:aspartyl-tRNA(Asn)/glutamyl-tRNA(Gln) amidotransferase subunit B|nr:Asp-tRNA(Asn)/Glu-tRNA(Gln) amidotransferase subunit GatB [Lactobacillales bacterium]